MIRPSAQTPGSELRINTNPQNQLLDWWIPLNISMDPTTTALTLNRSI
jgi:hypothetical protein